MITRSSACKRQASDVDDAMNSVNHTTQGHPDENKEPHSATHLPAKKKQKLETETKHKKRTRRKGALKDMLEMPLDILYEIFVELSPQDLLSLSRTTKAFRNLLISKSAIRFWKTAFQNSPDLPPRFPGMNELQFANLLFSSHCHNCFKPKIHTVFWMFQSRYCNNCQGDLLLKCDERETLDTLGIGEFAIKFNDRADKYLPITLQTKKWSQYDHTYYTYPDYYFVDRKWIDALKEEWKELKSADRDTIVRVAKERAQFITINNQCARSCEYWYNKKKLDRASERKRLRIDRFSAILDKLRDLGYGVEIDKCRDQTEKFLMREKLIREPKPLTDHVWRGMLEVHAVGIMDEVRAFRLDNEHEAAIKTRMDLLTQYLLRLRGKEYEDTKFPSPFDFLQIPRIRSIVDAPTEVTFTRQKLVAAVEPILPEVLEEWRSTVDRRLVQAINAKFTVANGLNPLTLAVGQFFRCNSCHALRDYPKIRAHTCTDQLRWSNARNEDNCYKQKSSIELYDSVLHRVFNYAPIHLNLDNIESVANIVAKVVAAKGHTASRATLEEVAKDNTLLVCKSCERRRPGFRPIMDWPSMIVHGIEDHSQNMSTRSATDAEVQAIEKLEIRYNEGQTGYLCWHCDEILDFVNKDIIKIHLKDRHKISDEFPEHVVQSSDQHLRTEKYRLLISDKIQAGSTNRMDEHYLEHAVSEGYGVVCTFAALGSVAKTTTNSRRTR